MPGYNVVGPAEAFSTTLENAILKHDEGIRQAKIAERQAKLDQMKMEHDKAYLDIEKERLEDQKESRKETAAEKVKEANTREATGLASRLMPNDVLTPDMTATLEKSPETAGLAVNPKQGLANFASTMPSGPAQQAVQQQAQGPNTFQGLPAARIAAQKTSAEQALEATLPVGSPERKILEYKRITGDNPPAGAFKIAGDETTPVMRQNPRTGEIEQVGTMPKGAHVMTEPPEKQPRPEPADHWQLHEVADPANPGKTKLVMFNAKTQEFRDATQDNTPVGPKPPKTAGGGLTPDQMVNYRTILKQKLSDASHTGLLGRVLGSGMTPAIQVRLQREAMAEAKGLDVTDSAVDDLIKALNAGSK